MIRTILERLMALGGILALLIVMVPIGVFIALDSKGGVFYLQKRIGQYGKPFLLYKFRTMRPESEGKGQLTIGQRDPRVTRVGYFLRKYKLDELPQLINVLNGTMHFVGPRPEVPKYVDLYTEEQRRVLSVKPGITDYASLKYFEESDLLASSTNPEQTYIHEIMPEKLRINLEYIDRRSISEDFRVVILTLKRILG